MKSLGYGNGNADLKVSTQIRQKIFAEGLVARKTERSGWLIQGKWWEEWLKFLFFCNLILSGKEFQAEW